jgi:hypothetical protein
LLSSRAIALLAISDRLAEAGALLKERRPPRQYDEYTKRYEGKLKAAVKEGKRRLSSRLNSDRVAIAHDLAWLQRELITIGQRDLPFAYTLGFASYAFGPQDDWRVAGVIERNTRFLAGSFIPYAHRILDERTEWPLDWTVGASIGLRLDVFDARIEMYASTFWAMIWMGLGARLELLEEATGLMTPVQRVLNPRAEHCSTCPPKAGIYPNWIGMLAMCGGLPADGSDECRGHCRCRIEFLGTFGWTEMFEWP